MSVTVDVNILLYAANEAAEEHLACRELVECLGGGPEILYLFWPTAMGFLRMSTHPRILPRPLTASQAGELVGSLIAAPHVRTPGEDEGFWGLYEATSGSNVRGNAVPDCHIAALMRQHGVRTIYTRDRGFRQYDGIETRDPVG